MLNLYDFRCSECKKVSEIYCSYEDIRNQICDECDGKLERLYISMPVFCKGIGSDTRLSDIAPNENASDEVKTKFKKMLKIRRRNPLNIRTSL